MMHLPLLVMKRGIIHLCKIGILFENRDFEHDVYELIKAFYPGNEITSIRFNSGSGIVSVLFAVHTKNTFDRS